MKFFLNTENSFVLGGGGGEVACPESHSIKPSLEFSSKKKKITPVFRSFTFCFPAEQDIFTEDGVTTQNTLS